MPANKLSIPNSSKISAVSVTGFAPCFISLSGPLLILLYIFPGTAITSRPCSKAISAVISAPLLSPASTIKTILDNPLIMRLRTGNLHALGGVPNGNSLITAPFCTISSMIRAFSRGYAISTPQPKTAMVDPFLDSSAPLCAAASIPRAIPLTTHTSCSANSNAMRLAAVMPYAVGLREPTIATALSLNEFILPFTNITGGGSKICFNKYG